MFCTKCGMQNEEGTKFCVGCGSSLEETEVQETPAETFEEAPVVEEAVAYEAPQKKGGIGKIIGIVAAIAVVVIAAFAVINFLGGGDKNNRAVIYSKGGDICYVQNGKTKVLELDDAETNVTSTRDGKYIYFLDEDHDLYYAPTSNPGKAVKIVGGVESFSVSSEENILTYQKDGNFYFSTNIKKEGKKIASDYTSLSFDKSIKNVIYINDENEMYVAPVANPDKKEKVAEDVVSFEEAWDEENGSYVDVNAIYYTVEKTNEKEDGSSSKEKKLMFYDGKKETEVTDEVSSASFIGDTLFYTVKVEKDDETVYDIMMVTKKAESKEVATGYNTVSLGNFNYTDSAVPSASYAVKNGKDDKAEYSFITSKGKVFEVDCEIGGENWIEDDKYFYNVEYNKEGKPTLKRYTIKESSFADEVDVVDYYSTHQTSENGDMYVITQETNKKGETERKLYYFNGKTAVEICEDYETSGFDGDTLYYVSDGELYKGSKKAGKKLADDVHSIAVRSGSCYYIKDYKEGEGDLYKVGSDKMIDDEVSQFGAAYYWGE